MAFNPLGQRGIPLDRQVRDWRELNVNRSIRITATRTPAAGGMQAALNGEERPPSDRVMSMHQEDFGREYRLEPEGKHPVASLRER